MGSISCHITSLLINRLRSGHTNTHTHSHTHTHICHTETIFRNQTPISHRSVHAWFKNEVCIPHHWCNIIMTPWKWQPHQNRCGKHFTVSYTVDGERFTGLNIHGFSTIEVFTEIFSHCLGHKCSLFSIVKKRCLYSWKNFHGTPENRENVKV